MAVFRAIPQKAVYVQKMAKSHSKDFKPHNLATSLWQPGHWRMIYYLEVKMLTVLD